MSGPNSSCEKYWGVNYRALSDHLQISHKTRDALRYDVGVQMIEIPNKHVRNLLTNDGSNKRLGIRSISKSNGVIVPNANLWPIEFILNVLDLMEISERNKAVRAIALNKCSSHSHSLLDVHVQGIDVSSRAVFWMSSSYRSDGK